MRVVYILLVAIMGVGAAAALAQTPQPSMLYIEKPYALATTAVQKNGAVFMRITNQGSVDEEIVSAETPLAERAELHTHIMDGDVMMMRPVESFIIPANQTVTLNPMGHHIMLMGLTQPLAPGESFPLSLKTKADVTKVIDVVVQSPGEAVP